MSNSEYKPRAGSLAEKVIAHLKKKPEPLSSPEIANLFGGNVHGVSTGLRAAAEAGVLVAVKDGNRFMWSLATPPAPLDGRLFIGTWSDGDVTVRGGVINEDDSVTFTRDQLEQLIAHVTTPHMTPRPSLGPAQQI